LERAGSGEGAVGPATVVGDRTVIPLVETYATGGFGGGSGVGVDGASEGSGGGGGGGGARGQRARAGCGRGAGRSQDPSRGRCHGLGAAGRHGTGGAPARARPTAPPLAVVSGRTRA